MIASAAFSKGLQDLSPSPDAKTDAWLFLTHILQKTRSALLLQEELTDAQYAQFCEMVQRRISGEPAQYIIGDCGFMGLDFVVDSRVLIPRQDTETLVEAALEFISCHPGCTALDLCTGSGAIAVSLSVLGGAKVDAADLSADALQVARQNAELQKAEITFYQGDFLSPVAGRRYDLICCNPPYIPSAEIASLQKEVLREPSLALDGGEDGLDFYRRLAAEYQSHLLPGGLLLMEVGAGQAEDVQALFPASSILPDINGIGRVVAAPMPQGE